MKAHPVAGLARINLTFRRLDPQTAQRAPACKCGQKAVLKVWPSWAGAACNAIAGLLVQVVIGTLSQARPRSKAGIRVALRWIGEMHIKLL